MYSKYLRPSQFVRALECSPACQPALPFPLGMVHPDLCDQMHLAGASKNYMITLIYSNDVQVVTSMDSSLT